MKRAILVVSPPVPTFGTHINVTHVDLPVKDKQGCHPPLNFVSPFFYAKHSSEHVFFLSFPFLEP